MIELFRFILEAWQNAAVVFICYGCLLFLTTAVVTAFKPINYTYITTNNMKEANKDGEQS